MRSLDGNAEEDAGSPLGGRVMEADEKAFQQLSEVVWVVVPPPGAAVDLRIAVPGRPLFAYTLAGAGESDG